MAHWVLAEKTWLLQTNFISFPILISLFSRYSMWFFKESVVHLFMLVLNTLHLLSSPLHWLSLHFFFFFTPTCCLHPSSFPERCALDATLCSFCHAALEVPQSPAEHSRAEQSIFSIPTHTHTHFAWGTDWTPISFSILPTLLACTP